jgi:hypothetical protein
MKKSYRPRLTPDENDFLLQYRKIKEVAYGKKEENGTELKLTSNLARSAEELAKEYDVDLNVWELVKFTPGSWTTPIKAKFLHEKEKSNESIRATVPLIIENRKSEAVFTKRTKIIDFEGFKKDLISELKTYSPKVSVIDREIKDTGNLLVPVIADLHLGKMAWQKETGDEDYDLKIAIQKHDEALDNLLNRALSCGVEYEKVLFVVGNDLFNSDNAYPYTQTTAGTPQQDDTRWQKVFVEGRKMIIRAIEKLKKIAPVEVKIVQGNHDFQKSFYLGDVLETRYENDDNVVIDNSPMTRKYFTWGKCFLGFTHGNHKDEGEGRLISNFQNIISNQKEIFKFKEIYCGDIHHYKEIQQRGNSKVVDKYAEDIDGIVVKYLRTLKSSDEWESKKGFNSQKGAHLFVWNKEHGNTYEIKYNS